MPQHSSPRPGSQPCRRKSLPPAQAREQQQGLQFLLGCFLASSGSASSCSGERPPPDRQAPPASPPRTGCCPAAPLRIRMAPKPFSSRAVSSASKSSATGAALSASLPAVLHPCTPQLCLHIRKHLAVAAARRQQIKQSTAPGVQPVGQGDARLLPRAQLRQRTAMIYDRQRPGRRQQRRSTAARADFYPAFSAAPAARPPA